MARMPGTKWAGEQSPKRPMSRYDVVCVHTIVGFAPAHAAHFSTRGNGEIIQSRDTKYQSGANLNGNHRVIAIENEDHGPAFGGTPKLPKWVPLTDAQVEACARILAWAHKTHGVPLQLCPDSKPGSRGLAYHRQGIDGNFGKGTPYPNPGRVRGGEVWSSSTGKVCPTDVRINQLPAILARAKQIVKGEPVKDTTKHPTFTLKMAHCSMQYSDTAKQMRSDVEKIFGRGYHIITGTEAGADNPLARILPAHAKKVGFKLHRVRDVWIAVDKDLVTSGWKTGYVPVIESTEGLGKHTDKGVGWAGFDNKYLGTITVGAAHLLTKGRKPGDPNYRFNKRFGKVWEEWLEQFGKGADLAFAAADQNIPDRTADTFFGADLTSSWDELGKYENTGHGNIDVIASYDKDGRVKAKSVRALDDREFHLHTDHFLVESNFEVRLLKNVS